MDKDSWIAGYLECLRPQWLWSTDPRPVAEAAWDESDGGKRPWQPGARPPRDEAELAAEIARNCGWLTDDGWIWDSREPLASE